MNLKDRNDNRPKPSPDPAAANPDRACERCGTCCRKGGPGFHQEDRVLIDQGLIPARCLFTIRKGEFAYDNVSGCLVPLDSDIIKIKGTEGTWTCIFLDEQEKGCAIYNDRPLECRTLKCWDTRELEKMYAGGRLTRRDLIGEVAGLWDLIRDHQARCDYVKIRELIKDLAGRPKSNARSKLVEIIKYDMEIRDLVVSRGGMDPEMLDFLFGRPLMKTLPQYGINVRQQGGKLTLQLNQPAPRSFTPRTTPLR